MGDMLDTFTDGVALNIGPFGCAMNFAMSAAQGAAPGTPGPLRRQRYAGR